MDENEDKDGTGVLRDWELELLACAEAENEVDTGCEYDVEDWMSLIRYETSGLRTKKTGTHHACSRSRQDQTRRCYHNIPKSYTRRVSTHVKKK